MESRGRAVGGQGRAWEGMGGQGEGNMNREQGEGMGGHGRAGYHRMQFVPDLVVRRHKALIRLLSPGPSSTGNIVTRLFHKTKNITGSLI